MHDLTLIQTVYWVSKQQTVFSVFVEITAINNYGTIIIEIKYLVTNN